MYLLFKKKHAKILRCHASFFGKIKSLDLKKPWEMKVLSLKPLPEGRFIFQPLCVQEQAVSCQGCNRLGGFHLTLEEVRVGSDWGSLKQVSNIFVSMDNNFPQTGDDSDIVAKKCWTSPLETMVIERLSDIYTPLKSIKIEHNYPKLPYSKRQPSVLDIQSPIISELGYIDYLLFYSVFMVQKKGN